MFLKRFLKTPFGWPVICSFICLILGVLSGLATRQGLPWYSQLVKPLGNPPAWVFGPVWSCLYVLMGIALGRLIARRDWRSVTLFGVQFLINLAWTPIFFVAHYIPLSVLVILSLWGFLLATILSAKMTDGIAARLLFPYLLWVSYATYLNAGILYLN